MLCINNLTISFGKRYLFQNVNFIVNKTDKIGLVGTNGSGKSTLLKIIAKKYHPDCGTISVPSDFSVAYLAQDLNVESNKTVLEEVHTAFEQFNILKKNIDLITNEMEKRSDYESDSYMKLITRLSDYTHKMYVLEEGSLDRKSTKVLKGLGFKEDDFNRPVNELSGGWQMRIELAKILLSNANVLLLDEPTNHLDMESILWLENFLVRFKGAVVLISHDKRFLDRLTSRTLEISLGKTYDYKSNYSKYLIMREERRQLQSAALKNQEKSIRSTEKFIERFRYTASKAKQVQSRIKQLEKTDIIEIEDKENPMVFRFPTAPHSGKISIAAFNLKKKYKDYVVFDEVKFELERRKKVAFVGKNGEGKSTMIKVILGQIDYTGRIKLGHDVKIAFYAQDQADELDGSKTVLETVDDALQSTTQISTRNLLGSFLFKGDDVEKKIKMLSGGERAKVALCKLLLSPVNLLILDEPTNHLDIASKQVLKQALLKYDGTLILVSHDRDFLTGLTSDTYEFKDKKVTHFLKDINEFLEYKKQSAEKDIY